MLIQENKRLDIILENNEKKESKKCTCVKVISLILLISALIGIIVSLIILKNDTNNCITSINNSSLNYETKFESIFAKLNEIEQKNLEYNTLLKPLKIENNDLKNSISLKDYIIETQYKMINELLFQITEMQNKDSEEKYENQNKELIDLIRQTYTDMKNNNTNELIPQKDESQNQNEEIKELIRQILIDIQDEELKKIIVRQSVELQVQYKYLLELISQKEFKFENKTKDLKELITQNDNKIQNLNILLKEIIQNNNINIQSGEWYVEFFAYNEYMHMMNSRGERSITKHIEFDVKFKKTPKVMVSINLFDTDRGTNLRVNVYAEHINTSGFDLRIATWDDTKLYRLRASWISFIYSY